MNLIKTMDEILELEAKATPEPWAYDDNGEVFGPSEKIGGVGVKIFVGGLSQDGNLTQASRNHIKQMALALKDVVTDSEHSNMCPLQHRSYTSRDCFRCWWLEKWDKTFSGEATDA